MPRHSCNTPYLAKGVCPVQQKIVDQVDVPIALLIIEAAHTGMSLARTNDMLLLELLGVRIELWKATE